MITVLCANAGLDKTFEVEGFQSGGYYFPKRIRTAPGGKGINVARILRALEQDVVVTGFAGGTIAQYITTALRRESITADFVGVAEESRLCINIIDPNRKVHTRIDEPGPLITPSEVENLRRKWSSLLQRSEIAVISGSTPRGVPFDLYGELILEARRRNVTVMLDAHDELLRDAVQAAPTVVKPNLAELGVLFGNELRVPDGVLGASRELVQMGVKVVLCSLGAEGALVVTKGSGEWRARAPRVQVINTVGAGDAMLAGFVASSAERRPLTERIKWAVAAGSASTTVFGAGFVTREEVEALVPQVVVEDLAQVMEAAARLQQPAEPEGEATPQMTDATPVLEG